MKKLFIGIAVLLVLFIGAIVVLPSLVPASAYKDKIETQLSAALDRDVTISGDVKLSVFPVLKAQTGAIQIDNPDGFSDAYFVTMDGLDARIRLLPLLSKKVEVAKFELTRPIINLEKKSNGDVNWVLGEATETPEPQKENESFKRDGRFNEFDPQIGKFAITDGQISFKDHTSNTAHDITQASLAFSLPSLDEIVNVDGDLTFNGTPIDLDVSLDTPRHFLSGGLSNFTVKLDTEFARINGKGQFAESEDIAFNAELDGNISDMDALVKLSQQEVPYSDLINQGKFSGRVAYDGASLVVNNSDVSAAGDLFDASFKGDATVDLTQNTPPIIAGRVEADVTDVPALAKAVEQNIDGVELIKTANLSAELKAKDKGFQAQNIVARLAGERVNATYNGQADIGEKITAQGAFTAKAQDLPAVVEALKLELEQEVIVNTADISGDINYSEELINVRLDKANLAGDNLSANYTGTVIVRGEDIAAKGDFSSDVKAIPSVLAALKLDVEQAPIFDEAKLSGKIDYTADAISVDLAQADLKSADLVAAYTGAVNVAGDVVSTKGTLSTLDIPSVSSLVQKAGLDNSAASSVGRVKLNQPLSVDYDGTRAKLDNLSVTLSDGALNGGFTGNVAHTLGDAPQTSVNGSFNGQAASLRKLAQSFDVALPASTPQGAIFEQFDTSGTINGDLNNINIELTSLNVDRLNGSGAFAVNMAGTKPSMTGKISFPELDVRPYQAAYAAPKDAPKGWSKEPLNVDGLKKFDADMSLSTGRLVTTSVAFGQSDIQAKVKNSRLTVDFPNMTLYGGRGNFNMSIDASRTNPVLDMDVAVSSLNTESVLAKFASFASATGTGATTFKVRGAGLSMDSIMKSLNGGGEFGVREGVVRGVDMATLLNGFSSGLSLQSAVTGLGSDKTTAFNDLVGKFSLKNGVMSINDFDFNAIGVAASGGGSVDIGNRTVDFKFKPRLTSANANSIAKAGIPLRISGDFASVKTGLDQSAVSSLLASQAQSLIQDQVSGQLGDTAGALLGSVLGGNGQSATTSSTGTTQPSTSPSVEGVLGSILGGTSSTQSRGSETQTRTEPAKREDVQPEDIARDVFGGLFGSKKKETSDKDE